MTDLVDNKRRSELMAGIHNRDTALELTARHIARRIWLRLGLRRKELLGCSTRMHATIDRTAISPHTARMPLAWPFRSRAMPMVVPMASLPRWAILRDHGSLPVIPRVTACGRSPSVSMEH